MPTVNVHEAKTQLARLLEAAEAGEDIVIAHRDPFDRLLIAQALCEPAYLLTADRTLTRYAAPIELMTAI